MSGVLLLLLSFSANADTFSPVEVSESALLFFVRPEDGKGASASGSDAERIEVLYAYDATLHAQPQRIWSGGNPRPRPIARLSRDVVLIERLSQHHFLNLRTGETTPLVGPGAETEFLANGPGGMFFLKQSVGGGSSSGSMRLGRSETDPNITVVKDYDRPKHLLYRYDVNATIEEKTRLLSTVGIERVLHHEGGNSWVISSGDEEHKGRKLCKLGRDGSLNELIGIDDHWVASMVGFHLSPSGNYLALTALHDQHDFHGERELTIVDLGKKRVAYSRERITDLFGGFGNGPSLFVRWHGISLLSVGWSELVDLSGPEVTVKPFPDDPSELLGPVLSRETTGFFDHEHGLLFFHGDEEPVANVLSSPQAKSSDLELDERGEWAAFVPIHERGIYLVDGRKKQKSLLLEGWCYGLRWLPAMKE